MKEHVNNFPGTPRRWSIRLLLALVFATGHGPAIAQTGLASVEFAGLQKTNEDFLRGFVGSRAGGILDSAQVRRDVQALRNLQLFSAVNYEISERDDGVAIEFLCRENSSFLPISNFGSSESGFWIQLGAADYNWLGRGNTLGGYYRFYDRNSFEVYLKSPYLIGQKWGLAANVNLYSTTEPAYFGAATTFYNVDRWAAIFLGRHSFSRAVFIEAGGGFLAERFRKNFDRSPVGAPGPDDRNFEKYLAKIALSLDRLNYFWHYRSGVVNELILESLKTIGERDVFWKIENVFRGYLRHGKSGNWAARLRVGIADNKPSPFAPFVLDSYLTVRGAGNRVARGTAELTLNVEYRHTVLERNWGAVQAVGFTDLSAWRAGGEDLSALFRADNTVSFLGVGTRLYLHRLNHLVLRADIGVSVTESEQSGIVLGLGQYF